MLLNFTIYLALYSLPHLLSIYLINRHKGFQSSHFPVLLLFVWIVVFVGARLGVGYDYESYSNTVTSGRHFLEPVPTFFAWIAYSFEGNFVIFFLLQALLTYGAVFYSSIIVKNWTPLYIFFCLPFFYIESFTIVRQSLALGICMVMYACYLNGRRYSALLASVFALMSHVSSFPFVAFMFILFGVRREHRQILMVFFIMIVLSVSPFLGEVVDCLSKFYPKLSFYAGEAKYGVGLAISLVAFSAFMIVINVDDMVKLSLMLASSLFIAAVLHDAVLARLAYYFVIPTCFVNIRRSSVGIILQIFLYLYFLAIFYVKYSDERNRMVPYVNYFWDGLI